MAFSWAGAAAGAYEARRQQQQDAPAAAEFELREGVRNFVCGA
jgi:hypothetical protein